MKDNYLIHGTNSLKGALRYIEGDDYRYETRSVSIYLASACKVLKYLVEDKETISMISQAMNRQGNQRYLEFESLMEEFIKPDHALMIAAGMDEKMASYFFRDVEGMWEAMRLNRDMHPELLRERIKELQYSVCEGDTNSSFEYQSPLKRSFNVIGGGAIITTNFAADTIVGGLASAFSQAFGGYIAGKGLDG